MNIQSPNFADDFEINEWLDVAKQHIDAIDHARVYGGNVIGGDNVAHLRVATVFSAIAIEAALNQYIQVHCLFVHTPYLQSFYATLTERFMWARTDEKLNLLARSWTPPIPTELIKDVRRLIEIRNKVIHQSWQFVPAIESSHGVQALRNRPPSGEDLSHMLRHYEIAHDFLSRFWSPGDRQLSQGRSNESGLTA